MPSPSDEQPSPASSSASSSQDEQEDAQESGASQSLTAAPPVTTVLNAPKPPAVQPPAETSNHANANETDEMQIEPVSSSVNESVDPPAAQETVMEEVIRATGTRLRKARSAPANRK